MRERDVDAEFDAIMSRWGQTPGDAPDAEQLPPGDAHGPIRTVYDISAAYQLSQRTDDDVAAAAESPAAQADSEDEQIWRGGEAAPLDDDHFEPPPVALPPGEDIGYWAVVIGMLGGPIMMIWAGLARPAFVGWWMAAGLAATLGGFAALVMRSPRDRRGNDGDDGARV